MNLTLLWNSILFLHNVISHWVFQDKLSVYSQINYLKHFICMGNIYFHLGYTDAYIYGNMGLDVNNKLFYLQT